MSLWPDVLDRLDGVTRQRVAWLTFGGTWGVPGTGYCSWVLGAADEGLVYEVPVPGPYSFGPIPAVSQSQGITGPSYRQSVDIAVEWAIAWILANPQQKFGLAGYSMGAEAASRVLWDLINPTGRLHHLLHNFVGGFTFGNPCREAGHTYPGGIDPGGSGISTFNLVGTPENWHDHAAGTANGAVGDDMYTTTPAAPSQVGKDMRDVYELATDLQLGDFMGFVITEVRHMLTVIDDLGGAANLLAGLASGQLLTSAAVGLISGLVPMLLGAILPAGALGGLGGLGGLIHSAGPPSTAPGVGAAVQAALIGIRFLMYNPPTAPHVTYEYSPAAPGVTHLQHAVGHVNEASALALAA